MRSLVRGLLVVVAVAAATLAAPATVTAHVNRYVGPYAFFMVLIEEPVFATNRAGFEFWVHDGDRAVSGLDRTLAAVASNGKRQVDLTIEPLNERGFYDVETDTGGQPFDPGSGGDWTLRLSGTVEGLPVTVSFPAVFPGYPRVATATQPAGATVTDAGPDVWLIVDAAMLLGAAAFVGRKLRRSTLQVPPTA